MVGLQLHRLHVEIRILPDLRIDEAGEEKAEETLGKAILRKSLMAEKGVLEFPVLAEA